MKYWFFDGNDVIGLFEPGELAARPGFGVTSLVCPEKFSEDQDSWRLAGAFGDFRALLEKPALSANPPEPATDSFEEEMDTLLKQRNPLGVPPDESAAEDLALEIPKKPAKPGPIEDYFNNIQGEDLGNILGIPDPNENSDMDLARALNTQLGKTNPPADKKVQPLENDPFDEFTADNGAAETSAEKLSQPAATSDAVVIPSPKETFSVKLSQEEDSPVQDSGTPPAPARAADFHPAPKSDHPTAGKERAAQKAPAVASATPTASEPAPLQPASIPISNLCGQDFVLSLHGVASPGEVSPAAPAANAAVSSGPAENNERASAQLPVLDQPVADIPPLTEAEPFLTQPAANPIPPEPAVSTTQENPFAELPAPETQPTVEPPCPAVSPAVNREPPSANQPQQSLSAPEPEEPMPEQTVQEETVRQILEEGKLDVPVTPEIKEPIKNITVEPELNQVRTRLKQTPEIKDFLRQTQNERIKRERSYKKSMAALSILLALIAVGVAVYINQTVFQRPVHASVQTEQPEPAAAPVQKKTEKPELQQIPVPPPPAEAEPSQADKAIELVKNHPLSGGRGTVDAYFARLYQTQKQQGYTAEWAAEPLHKSTYIVKYRLTKTRMEPIVYIFQADITQGKLTGALNNITLDLVGKIQ